MFWDFNYMKQLRKEIGRLTRERDEAIERRKVLLKDFGDLTINHNQMQIYLNEANQATADAVRLKESAEKKLREQTKADFVFVLMKMLFILITTEKPASPAARTSAEAAYAQALQQAQERGIAGIQPYASLFEGLFGQPFWKR